MNLIEDLETFLKIQKQMSKDIDTAFDVYQKKLEDWAQIKTYGVEKLKKENAMLSAQITYNEKLIAHLNFIES